MTDLSPAALAVWEAFNQDEPGVFVDYGDCLAAALRAAADQVVPDEPEPRWWEPVRPCFNRQRIRRRFLAIATELEQS
jgi:hypothetical protein